jgi:hypothetical protein
VLCFIIALFNQGTHRLYLPLTIIILVMLASGLARKYFSPSQSLLFVSRHFYHQQTVIKGMKVVVVPALSDNFSYLVVDKSTGNAFAVGL